MCRSATVWLIVGAAAAYAQQAGLDWRRQGTTTLELRLAGPASGAVDRVWHSADGALFARTSSGTVFRFTSEGQWSPSTEAPPERPVTVARAPEQIATLRASEVRRGVLYAAGTHAWRSEDGGQHWANLTEWKNQSILGGALADISVSPSDADEIVVAGRTGVWRSLDGGLSWNSLNNGLPNLAVERILATPSGTSPLRIAGPFGEAEWQGAVKTGWVPVPARQTVQEATRRARLTETLRSEITATASSADALYAAAADGTLWASLNNGRSWNRFPTLEGAKVESLFVSPRDPQYAVAAINTADGGHVFRTANGGVFWDNISEGAALSRVRGLAADQATGAVYAATDKGVWMTYGGNGWSAMGAGLPERPATDVRLNAAGHQLYVAIEGYGVYAAVAPHRTRDPRLVSAGDLSERPAAPGALLTVIGRAIDGARAGGRTLPVLAQSQVQIPFDVTGGRLDVQLDSTTGTTSHRLAVQPASPSVMVDADGTPLITDMDTGLLLDAGNPVRPGARLQILATGLGRVTPDWPAGLPAPASDAPRVVGPVRVLFDRAPIEVTRAVLAPGYVGFYLVEIELPAILNAGTAELYIEAAGHQSNAVKLYIEP